MCKSPRDAALYLHRLPEYVLCKVYSCLDLSSRFSFTSTCRSFRRVFHLACGKALVWRSISYRQSPSRCTVSMPQFLTSLASLCDLVVEIDASAPLLNTEEVLSALAVILCCLPHCHPSSLSPQLRLTLRVHLWEGPGLGDRPQLSARLLDQLLHRVGLPPLRLCSLQLECPSITLDGGLAAVLCAARCVAEQDLVACVEPAAPYPHLRYLDLDVRSPQALAVFGEQVLRHQYPALQHLRLAQHRLQDPPGGEGGARPDLSFLAALPQLASLELSSLAVEPSRGSVPRHKPPLPHLPHLQRLALVCPSWSAVSGGACSGAQVQDAGGGWHSESCGRGLAALREACPGVRRLHLEGVDDDEGVPGFQGLTSLVIQQPSVRSAYQGFSWATLGCPLLEEVQLRGGEGWMDPGASWRRLLQPKEGGFSGCPSLRRLVFDVRGWGPQLPEQPEVEGFLRAVLDTWVSSGVLPGLRSVHAVLEEGPYRPARNDLYFAEEGHVGTWGAVHDAAGGLWLALLAAEQTPRVLLMQKVEKAPSLPTTSPQLSVGSRTSSSHSSSWAGAGAELGVCVSGESAGREGSSS